MAISDARGVRHVRCPKCHSVLEEPSDVPVYQCGGCGARLRVKISTGYGGDTREAPAPVSAPSSGNGRLHPRSQSRHLGGASDVASTSAVASDAQSTGHRGADTTSRSDSGHLMSASPPVVEKKGHERQSTTTIQDEAGVSSEHRNRRGSDAPDVSFSFSRWNRGSSAELRDSEKRKEPEPEADAARKNNSGEAPAQPRRRRDLDEVAATSPARTTMDSQSTGDVLKLSPLHEKILKTVDELKDDLSELFSKSPEVEPRTPARSPRHLPRRDRHASRPPPVPTSRARHADAVAAGYDRGSKAGYVGGKHGHVAPRGLPSRRYRRCRADSCTLPEPCRYSCSNHGKPECTSCRSHCCGYRAQEPARRQSPPADKGAKRRAPPRYHCRPVLKGAPFIICSSCFTLVQVPAGFAVSNMKVSKLRCGSCSAVLSYSYRDPDGKKLPPQSLDKYSTDGSYSEAYRGKDAGGRPDPFSFIEDFAHGASCSYSTEDDQPLHVSRNSSLSTIVGDDTPAPQTTALHRLMGYDSASELLFLRRSPSLYESSGRRSTPDSTWRLNDRKGKGIWVDDTGDDDSRGPLRRSIVRGGGAGAGRTHGRGGPAPGAIRIRS